MGARSGYGLKILQWFIRGVQLGCGAIILGIYAYFLATLHNHNLDIPTSVRAVAGISGAGVLYAIIGLLLLCCLAGIKFTSFIAILLDVAFAGAYIYVATANRGGASDCTGYLDTPFGSGQSDKNPDNGSGGFTVLPSFHVACRLQTACLAIAIIAIFFYIFSILMEVALARHHHKEKRYGPSPANNYTSGYGDSDTKTASTTAAKGGFFSRLFGRNKSVRRNDDMLPEHATPDDMALNRQSYATDNTAINPDTAHNGRYKSSYEQPLQPNSPTYDDNPYDGSNQYSSYSGYHAPQQTGYRQEPPNGYQYEDGVYNRA